MGWFYDFDSFNALTDAEFEEVKALSGEHDVEETGLGKRLWVDKFQFEAPLLLLDIKSILFKSSQLDKLPEIVKIGSQAHYKMTGIGKIASPKLVREQQFKLAGVNLKSPRDAVGLTTSLWQGSNVKVAVIDSSFNLTSAQLNKFAHRIINFTQKPLGKEISHGTKVTSIIAGADFSIAPQAELFIACVSPSLGCLAVALIWAAKQKVDIINVSKVIGQSDTARGIPKLLQRAVDFCTRNNCLIVAASSDFSNGPCSALALIPQVVSVNSMISDNSLIFNSAQAGDLYKIDCVTWGRKIMSLNDFASAEQGPFNYASAATPIVTASVAIFKQMRPKITSMQKLKTCFFTEFCAKHSSGGELWGRGTVSFKNI